VRFWTRAAHAEQADAEAAMARLGLDGRLRDVAVGRLSTGQRRRTSLACLVARRPELWWLDQDGRDVVDELVRDACRAGATVILSSHELDRSLELADEVVTIAGGAAYPEQRPGSSDSPASPPSSASPTPTPTGGVA
jgi:ABC-type multidrug transport system ATPase subunit